MGEARLVQAESLGEEGKGSLPRCFQQETATLVDGDFRARP